MFQLQEFSIYKAVMHTVSKDDSTANFSKMELDLEENLVQFLENAVAKLYQSKEARWSRFQADSSHKLQFDALHRSPSKFMDVTRELSEQMHELVLRHEATLPSFDMMFLLLEMGKEFYFAGFKWNHSIFYIRHTEPLKEGHMNVLEKKTDLYIKPKARIEEGFLINLNTLDALLLDKLYKIEEEKQTFFQETLFETISEKSKKDNLIHFNKMNQSFFQDHLPGHIKTKAMINKTIADSVDESGAIDVSLLLEKAEVLDDDVFQMYKHRMEKEELSDKKIEITEQVLKSRYRNQKIKTMNGCVLTIPTEQLIEEDEVQIEKNEDGSVNITIKNAMIMEND